MEVIAVLNKDDNEVSLFKRETFSKWMDKELKKIEREIGKEKSLFLPDAESIFFDSYHIMIKDVS